MLGGKIIVFDLLHAIYPIYHQFLIQFICINPIRVPCSYTILEAPLIVDVGANVGLFALWARERWTKCQV